MLVLPVTDSEALGGGFLGVLVLVEALPFSSEGSLLFDREVKFGAACWPFRRLGVESPFTLVVACFFCSVPWFVVLLLWSNDSKDGDFRCSTSVVGPRFVRYTLANKDAKQHVKSNTTCNLGLAWAHPLG